jgi:hypothetical protein
MVIAALILFSANPVNHSPADCEGLHLNQPRLVGSPEPKCAEEFDEARLAVDGIGTLLFGVVGWAIAAGLVESGVASKEQLGMKDD